MNNDYGLARRARLFVLEQLRRTNPQVAALSWNELDLLSVDAEHELAGLFGDAFQQGWDEREWHEENNDLYPDHHLTQIEPDWDPGEAETVLVDDDKTEPVNTNTGLEILHGFARAQQREFERRQGERQMRIPVKAKIKTER